MADIRLDEKEIALWNEAGTRGDAFRRATRDRAAEQARLHEKMTEVIDGGTQAVRATQGSGEADPESPAPSPGSAGETENRGRKNKKPG